MRNPYVAGRPDPYHRDSRPQHWILGLGCAAVVVGLFVTTSFYLGQWAGEHSAYLRMTERLKSNIEAELRQNRTGRRVKVQPGSAGYVDISGVVADEKELHDILRSIQAGAAKDIITGHLAINVQKNRVKDADQPRNSEPPAQLEP